jgi:hypothetical protein
MIGNMAYASSDLTVLGKDALSCEGGSSQGGSNATVSGISATVEVSAPSGVNSNVAYQMKTYVGGYLDKDATDDRADSWGSVGQLVPSAYNSDYAGRRITSYESPLAYKGSVTDNTGSKSYTEEEKFYFYAQPKYDASSKTVKSQQPKIGYEAVFTDPIPVCTNQNPSNTTCDQQYKSDTHRIKIKLLGAEWVIYGMYNFNPSGISGSSTQVVLGKEVQYKEFMQIGEDATAPNGYKAKLKDISAQPYGGIHESAVAFEIYDANGNMVDIATLQSGGTNEYSKFGLTIKLWQAFVGTTGAAYAKVSVVSDKLTLINNGEIDSDNRPWMVSIQEGGSTFGASLSKIQLTNVAESTNGLSAGESLYFVKKPKLMAFTFNGIETVSSSDSLRMNFISPQYLPMNSTDSTTRANVVVLQSNRANAFQFGGDSSDRAYYVIGANNSIPMGSILYNKNGFFQLYTGNVNGTLNFVDYNYGPNTIKIAFNSASIEPNAYPDMADYVIHVPEYTTDSDGAPYAYKIDVGNAETSNPSFTQSGSN